MGHEPGLHSQFPPAACRQCLHAPSGEDRNRQILPTQAVDAVVLPGEWDTCGLAGSPTSSQMGNYSFRGSVLSGHFGRSNVG